ncbi:MAG: VWA domain-containing protein [Verrucomicrobiota bacterium]
MIFQNPIIIAVLAILLPIILLLMIDGQRRLQKQLSIFISPRLLGRLAHSFSRRLVWVRNILVLLSILLLGVGAARPQWGSEMREIEGRGIDIIFALDASNSMLAEDIIPNRIERSKLAIRDFIKTTVGDQIGIIAFAGDAFLQCPPTFDMNAFRMTLKSIVPGIIPHRGTDIAAAIDEAKSAFPEGENAKILILMTDGEDLEESGIEAAREAAEAGIVIYTVGVGGATGSRIPVTDRFGSRNFMVNPDGTPVITRLDEKTLVEIAQAAGGLYVPLGASGNGLEILYEQRLASLPDQLREATVEEIPFERYAWFVIPGFILLTAIFFVGNRRAGMQGISGSAATFALGFLILASLTPKTSLALRDSYEGYSKLKSEDWVGAIEILTKLPELGPEAAYNAYNLGVARYQAGDYAGAITSFQAALSTSDLDLQADAFYNLGMARISRAIGVDASEFDLNAINEALRQSFEASYEALKFGEDALLEIPLRRKAWTQCEQVLRQMLRLDERLVDTSDPARDQRKLLLDAELSWLNAEELTPDEIDIQKNLGALQNLLTASELDWEELARHQEMLPQIENALEDMIYELKKPTQAVIQAEAIADKLVTNNEYFDAVDILEEIAKNDPTADIYKRKQNRLREIVNILAPPPTQTPPNSEFGNP